MPGAQGVEMAYCSGMRSSALARSLTALLAVGAVVPAGARQAPDDVPLLKAGLYTRTLARDSGPTIHYAIEVPRGYSPDARVPLVLALHFGGEPFDESGKGVIEALVGPALAALGAVIVAPDALAPGWDAPVNEAAVMFLLDRVARRYNVDPARVVVTGFSMGGSGTWHYAGKYPGRFSAAIPVAGRPPELTGAWRVPTFAVNSRRDTLVPMGPTVQGIAALKQMGVNAEMIVLERPTHFQTSSHAEGLTQAVPWLKALWGR